MLARDLRRASAMTRVVGLLGLGFLLACSSPPEPQGPPNMVILFADDLGYGDLSSYGHPTIQTPELDRMAREGIRLTSFYTAAPSCSPARAALLTGRYPMRAGVPNVLGPESTTGINPEEITLAEALKERGYRTMAIGKWHLGHRKEEFLPNSNGFDEYFGLLYSNDMQPPWVKTDVPLELFRNSEAIEYPVDQDQLTKRYTEEAVRFIRSAPDKPFFVYLAYSMPHVPIHTFKEMQGRSRAGLYGDVIETIDWSAGEILKTLQSLGIGDNTIVVFTSDNGPWLNMPDRMFGEGKVKPWDAGSAGSLRGWKHQTYEGGMRVPGIVRWPNRVPSDQVSAEVATTLDLYVSLVEAAGGLVPDDRPIDGRNILRLLEGKGVLEEEPFFYIRGRQLQAVRVGRWKLRVAGEGEPELFDLEVDPSERYNLAVQHPEIVTDLASQMVGLAGELGAGTVDNLKELSGTD